MRKTSLEFTPPLVEMGTVRDGNDEAGATNDAVRSAERIERTS